MHSVEKSSASLSSYNDLDPATTEFSLALLELRAGSHRQARKSFLKILQQDPMHAEAMSWVAKTYTMDKKWREAELVLHQALALMPQRVDWLIEMGQVKLALNLPQEAVQALRQGVELCRESSEQLFDLYRLLGNALLHLKDIDGAEENYHKAYRIKPNDTTVLVNMGTLEIQRGNWNQAADYFRAAVRVSTNNDRAWVGLALVHRQFGDAALAWANLEAALDSNFQNEVALQLVAEWCVKDQKVARAVQYLKVFVDSIEFHRDLQIAYVKLLFLLQLDVEAKIELEKILLFDPACNEALRLLEIMEGR